MKLVGIGPASVPGHDECQDVTMREEFQAELQEVGRLLVDMAEAVRVALRDATTALLDADQAAAQAVIDADSTVDALYRQVEERVCDVIARQAPVATDLRTVISALHISADIERMGDLSSHVARTAIRRYPAPAVPAELAGVVRQMADVADRMAAKIKTILGEPDAVRASELDRDDDVMDDLERQLFEVLLGPDWSHGVEAAVDAALLARFYERYADHAVNSGHQIVYLVTGQSLTS
jgi:phosphate transport system protein